MSNNINIGAVSSVETEGDRPYKVRHGSKFLGIVCGLVLLGAGVLAVGCVPESSESSVVGEDVGQLTVEVVNLPNNVVSYTYKVHFPSNNL